ncbi:MAG: oligosaccharide flippase family protein [Pseudomonadota bacterium]
MALKKLISNLIVNYSTSLVGFLITILCARILGATEYSWMAFGLAVAGFAIPILNLGNEGTFVRDAVSLGHAGDVERMICTSFGIRVMLTLILSIILAIASVLYTHSIMDAMAMFSISLWASLLGLYPSSWYDYVHKTRNQNILVLSERIASLVLLLILFFMPVYMHLAFVVGIALLLVRMISISMQVNVWWRLYAESHFKWCLTFRGNRLGGVNLPVTTALFFNAIATYGNQLILGNYQGKTELAAYGLVFQIMSLIFIFQGLWIRLMSRHIAETCKSKTGILRSIFKNSMMLALGSAVLAMAVWVGIKYLHLLLDDPRYVLMNKFSTILCIWVVVVGAGQAITQHSFALHQESLYLSLAIIGGLMALFLGITFVPQYGGEAVASILLGVNSLIILAELIRILFLVKTITIY